MRGNVVLPLLACALLAGCSPEPNNIEREAVERMFASVPESPEWDLNSPMVWGYFFEGQNESTLEPLRVELERRGYQFVGYLAPGRRNKLQTYFLHVERVESHSVESLDRRNQELTVLGNQFQARYDGMDVGPPK